MSLIKSISGIRGTLGGKAGENLSPVDIVKFTSAYAELLRQGTDKKILSVVVGRDARPSGEMVNMLVKGALTGMGVNVIDLGLSTTPSVEIAVIELKADGGIIITASHNPKNWNALKLLNAQGEFINNEEGNRLLEIASKEEMTFAEVNSIGSIIYNTDIIEKHIESILKLKAVNTKAIRDAGFKIAVDCVNSTGAISILPLLKALGIKEIIEINCNTDGNFPHNPEPLPEHLTELASTVSKYGADLGFAVDPDVDRLAIICEDGEMFGEEYTIVAVADYILKLTPGNTVSNLSSSRALRDITEKAGCNYFASAVGEVNVVAMMKQQNAVIGGEGNGGVIYPELHYGRDALVGIALFLSHLATSGVKCSKLRAGYPNYIISKNKIELPEFTDIDSILSRMQEKYKNQPHTTIDGLKIDFDDNWVHLRKSNTEPIIRIYAESNNATTAEILANKIIGDIRELLKPEEVE